jgi:hypothetical protein
LLGGFFSEKKLPSYYNREQKREQHELCDETGESKSVGVTKLRRPWAKGGLGHSYLAKDLYRSTDVVIKVIGIGSESRYTALRPWDDALSAPPKAEPWRGSQHPRPILL